MAELLETSIQVSGLSERELEKRLGWKAGSLGRLLEGETEIEPQHVLKILGELNGVSAPPPDADELADERTQVVSQLLERYNRLGYEKVQVGPAEPAGRKKRLKARLDTKELEEKIEKALREAFQKSSSRKALDEG